LTRVSRKRTIWLVQQGVWDMPKESLPLGIGYLKAAALADDGLRPDIDVRLFNFNGGDSVLTMAQRLFRQGAPDLIGFSVWGWNYRQFGELAETYKQLAPNGWVVFGGTHVANQGERVLRQYPAVDVVVDGEGELVFRDLLAALLGGRRVDELHGLPGVSFRDPEGRCQRNPARERIANLDDIPSPFLTGAIPLTDERGGFRYDVALMETSRGCPYRCAFCYWGGAIGQKMRTFSRDRLRAELEVFARHRVHTIVLCDSNFGMMREDKAFVEDVIAVRNRYGYPRAIETSWAKNKSRVFYDIVRTMKSEGLRSSFTLALQTLNDEALDAMQRRNMKLNEWEDLVAWLRSEGLDCYAELIWGAPGETARSFLQGYDRLATHMSRIAPYQLLLLPNTEYAEAKERFGLVTVRGERDDFEHVLAHRTMTVAENVEMRRFLVWARALAEHLVLRHVWTPLRQAAGMTQSAVIRSLLEWVEASDHPTAAALTDIRRRLGLQPEGLGVFLRHLYLDPRLDEVLHDWWCHAVLPRLPGATAAGVSEVFRYDCLTRAVFDEPGNRELPAGLEAVEVDGEPYYVRRAVRFAFDVPRLLREGHDWAERPAGGPVELDLYYRAGFHSYYVNHEEAVYFPGQQLEELRTPARPELHVARA